MSREQYQVFQIKDSCHDRWGRSYEQQIREGFLIRFKNYKSVYRSMIVPLDTPDSVRKRLEEKKPNTFISTRRIGVGDVIVWSQNDTLRFFYVDGNELVEFGGFMPAGEGCPITAGVPYQIEGKAGSWFVVDDEFVENSRFYLMQNVQYKESAANIIVDEQCGYIMDAPEGFGNKKKESLAARKRQRDSMSCEGSNSVSATKKPDNHRNIPEKPRVINGRISVLDRLHIKQAQRAAKAAEQVSKKEQGHR